MYQVDLENDQNVPTAIQQLVNRIADARNDCKLVLVGVQNVIDHGTPAAQVIIFRERQPSDGLCVITQ